jgi:SAM-dependent methyltransferase
MKLRDSGMPPRDYWESLVDVPVILDRFDVGSHWGDVAELGCGYGTFTLPLAARIGGVVHAFDIDAGMVETTRQRLAEAGRTNARVELRDVLESGFGLPDESCDAVLLFNILHGERPVDLLREAARVLRPGGMVAVIHWRTDIATPRGPSGDIRPQPAQIAAWASHVPALGLDGEAFELPPWHYGFRFRRI